jgi:hypothetical protein
MPAAKWPKAAFSALALGSFLGIFPRVGDSYGRDAPAAQPAMETGSWTRTPHDKAENPSPDLNQPCGGPGTTPVCALKTYLACVLYDAPRLCAAVGLDGVSERYPGADTIDADVLAQPWAMPFERLMPEAFALHIYDGGFVPAARFQTVRQAPGVTMAGTYELMMDIPEPAVKDLVYTQSYFFRHNETGWKMVSWASSRARACDAGAGTAAWAPCRWFLRDLQRRNVFAEDVTPLWASPKIPGRDDYPYPGLEIMMGLPNQPVVAPFAGTVIRRSLKYPDTPLYDWVVIQGENRQSNMTAKFAMVDRSGPKPGERVDAATRIGKPQWLEEEHPGTGRFIHIELLRDGRQIDPRSVMRERRASP